MRYSGPDAGRAETGCAGLAPTPSAAWARRWMTCTRRRRAHLLQFRPAQLELVDRGHVGHRAARGQVGKNDLLMRRREHVSALGHEVDTAEHDELGIGILRTVLSEAVRIAGHIGEPDHLVALVVMSEDQHTGSERALRRGDPVIELLVRESQVPVRQRLALAD
jgi:hypothetical protein